MILTKSQKIIEAIEPQQSIERIASNDVIKTVGDDSKVDSFTVKNMLQQFSETLQPGKYYLKYEKVTINKESDMIDGVKYRIDLVPIKVMKAEEVN